MKSILITGANRGIGLELTRQYLQSGEHVIATCRDLSNADPLRGLQNTEQGKLTLFELDVTSQTAIDALSQQFAQPIDVLINNAGYYGPKGCRLGGINPDDWIEVFKTNTIAPCKVTEALVAQLSQAQDLAKVIIMTSKMGSITDNESGASYAYRSSKAAVNAVMKSLSVDLKADNIAVLSIHPGWVQTDMGGPNALITAAQSAEGIIRVISEMTLAESGQFVDYSGAHIPW